MAAEISQLFSYMIDKGVQCGYISTGEAFVFGHIPDNPTSFLYSVNIPRRDYESDPEYRLQRTAVLQVFAFTLQALRAGQPSAAWADSARTKLSRWKQAVGRVSSIAHAPPARPQFRIFSMICHGARSFIFALDEEARLCRRHSGMSHGPIVESAILKVSKKTRHSSHRSVLLIMIID